MIIEFISDDIFTPMKMAGKGNKVVMLFGKRNKGTDGESPPFV
jgi:putative heme degradation protein